MSDIPVSILDGASKVFKNLGGGLYAELGAVISLSEMPTNSTPLTGTASASTVVGPFTPQLARDIILTLSGTWTGAVVVKRSVDGGTTKLPLTVGGSSWGSYAANCQEPVWLETEAGATYYLDITIATGTLAYRMAQ